jgi:acyl carrier protein
MTEREVFERLVPLIEEVTAVPRGQITMESVLMQDLGAESLDLLDLSFLVDETFGVTLEPDDFQREVRRRMPEGVYERDGFLTDDALAALRDVLPEVPSESLAGPLPAVALPSVLNVAVFVHLIQRKLAQKEEEATHA